MFGQPPFETEVNTGDVGFDIKFPQIEFVELNEELKLHFHVFNRSSGLPVDNVSTECYFHLYSPVGGHVYIEDKISVVSHLFDFEVELAGSNFSSLGLYSYIFQCNNSDSLTGGFVGQTFEVTSDGRSVEEQDVKYLGTVFLSIFVIVLFIAFGTSSYFKDFKKLFMVKLTRTISYACFILSVLEFLFLLALVKSSYILVSLEPLVSLHFIIMFVVLMSVVVVLFIMWGLDMLDISEVVEDSERESFSKKKW